MEGKSGGVLVVSIFVRWCSHFVTEINSITNRLTYFFDLELVVDLGNGDTDRLADLVAGGSFQLLSVTELDRQVTGHLTPVAKRNKIE